MTIIWCMVPAIWRQYYVHHGDSFLSFWTVFCPFTPLTTQKNQNFEKLKKKPGDIIILHKCIKNHDHMLYCYLDIVRNEFNCYFSFFQNFLSIWPIFALLPTITAWKIKILKKWKKPLEISSFYICVPKIMIRWSTVPKIWCMTDGNLNC